LGLIQENSSINAEDGLNFQTESQTAVRYFDDKFVIDSEGNFIATESVTADTVVVDGMNLGSVGKAKIESGEQSVTITDTNISEYSAIFLTTTSPTNQRIYVKTINPFNNTFSVSIVEDEKAQQEMRFNYWIVGK